MANSFLGRYNSINLTNTVDIIADSLFIRNSNGTLDDILDLISGGGGGGTTTGLITDRVLISNGLGELTTSNISNTTLGFLDATSSIQTQINSKQNTISLTTDKAVISDVSGILATSTLDAIKLNYLTNVDTDIQDSLNARPLYSEIIRINSNIIRPLNNVLIDYDTDNGSNPIYDIITGSVLLSDQSVMAIPESVFSTVSLTSDWVFMIKLFSDESNSTRKLYLAFDLDTSVIPINTNNVSTTMPFRFQWHTNLFNYYNSDVLIETITADYTAIFGNDIFLYAYFDTNSFLTVKVYNDSLTEIFTYTTPQTVVINGTHPWGLGSNRNTLNVEGFQVSQGNTLNITNFDCSCLNPSIQAMDILPNKALYTNDTKHILSSLTTDVELDYLSGVTSNIQTQMDSKADYIDVFSGLNAFRTVYYEAGRLKTSEATYVHLNNLASIGNNKAVMTNSTGHVIQSLTSDLELNFLNGATSNIQTQINNITPIPSLTADRVIISDGTGSLSASLISNTTLNFLDVSSSINTQLIGKAPQLTTYTKIEIDGLISNISAVPTLLTNKVVISNAIGGLESSTVSDTELSNLTGTTSNIQTQLDDLSSADNIVYNTEGLIKPLSTNTLSSYRIALAGVAPVYDNINQTVLLSNESLVAFNSINYPNITYTSEWSCVLKLRPESLGSTTQRLYFFINCFDNLFENNANLSTLSEFWYILDRNNGRFDWFRNGSLQHQETLANAIQDNFYGNDIYFVANRNINGTITLEVFDASYVSLASVSSVANIIADDVLNPYTIGVGCGKCNLTVYGLVVRSGSNTLTPQSYVALTEPSPYIDAALLVSDRVLYINNDRAIASTNTNSTQINYINNVSSDIQTQIDSKQDIISLTSERILVSNTLGNIGVSGTNSGQLNYLNDVTNNLQSQIDGKQAVISVAPDKVLISNGSSVITHSTTDATKLIYLNNVVSDINTKFTEKADVVTTYTKTETDELVSSLTSNSIIIEGINSVPINGTNIAVTHYNTSYPTFVNGTAIFNGFNECWMLRTSAYPLIDFTDDWVSIFRVNWTTGAGNMFLKLALNESDNLWLPQSLGGGGSGGQGSEIGIRTTNPYHNGNAVVSSSSPLLTPNFGNGQITYFRFSYNGSSQITTINGYDGSGISVGQLVSLPINFTGKDLIIGLFNNAVQYTLDGIMALQGTTGAEPADLQSQLLLSGLNTIDASNIDVDKVLIVSSGGEIQTSTTTATELSYLSGVNSNIQNQIDDLNFTNLIENQPPIIRPTVSNTVFNYRSALGAIEPVFDSIEEVVLLSDESLVAFNSSSYQNITYNDEWSAIFKVRPVSTFTTQKLYIGLNCKDNLFSTSTDNSAVCEYTFIFDRNNATMDLYVDNVLQMGVAILTSVQDTFYNNDIYIVINRNLDTSTTLEIFDEFYVSIVSASTVGVDIILNDTTYPYTMGMGIENCQLIIYGMSVKSGSNKLTPASYNGSGLIIGNTATIFDNNRVLVSSDVSSTELSYLSGVNSSIQSQLNALPVVQRTTITITSTGSNAGSFETDIYGGTTIYKSIFNFLWPLDFFVDNSAIVMVSLKTTNKTILSVYEESHSTTNCILGVLDLAGNTNVQVHIVVLNNPS